MIVQKHRPDIEGLRAVAIMAVILFHSSLATFSGGYVGVDVFFVISGFLITKSINHRSANNEFSFLNYYIARIKRIYPLLILILSLQLLIAPYFYYPMIVENLSKVAISAIGAVSNIYLLYTESSLGYFKYFIAENPLLHTWSLSIEIQLYLLWPFILLGINRINKNRSLFYLLMIFSALVFVQFYHNEYYSTLSRMNAFVVGAISYEITNSKYWDKIKYTSYFGLILILYSIIKFLEGSNYPGHASLIPIGGTFLVLVDNSKTYFKSFLSLKPLQFIGKISYSLYIWHWPILCTYQYVNFGNFDLIQDLISVYFVIVLTSYFSWKYVEKPFRKIQASKKLSIIFGVAFIFISSLSIFYIYNWKDISNKIYKHDFNMIHEDEFSIYYNLMDMKIDEAYNEHVLLGNSYGHDLIYGMRQNKIKANFTSLGSTHHCYNFGTEINKNYQVTCQEKLKENLNKIKELKFKYLFLHDDWQKFDLANLKDRLAQIREYTKNPIYIFGPRIKFISKVPKIIFVNRHQREINKIAQKFRSQEIFEHNKRAKEVLNTAEFENQNIYYVDLLEIQCEKDICDVVSDKNEILFTDNGHLTVAGSRILGLKLKEKYPFLY